MLMSVRSFLLILTLICLSLTIAEATHLRAGNITLTRLSCSDYKYRVTLHIYTRWNAPVKFSMGGAGELNFGDGDPVHHPPQIDNPPIIGQSDNGPIGEVIYSIDHRFPGPGVYTLTYYEQNRNEGILNIDNSRETPFFIQTEILIDDILGGCNNTPQLLVPPIDQGCKGVKWSHNPGAYDPDGDSLSYELYVPKQSGVYNSDGYFVSAVDVPGYNNPNAQKFYASVNIPYSQANEARNGPPTFSIDPVTGTITCDAPGMKGEYNIAFIIREWRKVKGTSIWVSLGYVERDMQIVIQDCNNKRPKLTVPPDVCVEAGTLITQDIFAVDPAVNAPRNLKQDGDSVKIEAFSEIFTNVAPVATYVPGPSVWQPTYSDTQQAVIHFSWQTACAHVKEQPYQVVFKATDNGSPRLASFETWKIRIVAPAPVWNSATLDLSQRSAQLQWKPYTCANAQFMQVWRKVDSSPFTPPTCVTGMPEYLGYTMIGLVPIGTTNFTDRNLAVGAKYCYRLVAAFPQPDGGESYVSQEICLPPIIAKAPVITNVSIEVTDVQAGKISVKWRSPFDVDKTQFPPPYSYQVLRAEGFSGNINIKPAHPGKLTEADTSNFVDTGLNTANNVYNYRVICYASNGSFDTSAVASSVRLELKPLGDRIQLNWNAAVPWSNNTVSYPLHDIYRTTNTGSKVITDLTLIGTVNVNQYMFVYTDSGQFNNTPLVKTQDYCYAVKTRGSYGNPKIQAPLENLSEITCINLNSTEPPCKVELAVKGIDCSNFNTCPVLGATVSNTIRWKRSTDSNCQKEIRGYNIYAANAVGDSFTKIAELVTDTFYVHNNLPSFAQCYKVSAVSRAGVESELSDQFCFDNCPYYELPNVFTPNGDGCNDKFSAFSIRFYGDPDEGYPCGNTAPDLETLRKKCARFVSAVTFIVYNRWGREVYRYQSGGENTIYIDWNGKDNNGRDLDGGVYYYSADVVFDVVDPKRRNQTIKGWVQIIR